MFALCYALVSWCFAATLAHATAVVGFIKGAEQVITVGARLSSDVAIVSVGPDFLVVGCFGSLVLCALDGSYFSGSPVLNLVRRCGGLLSGLALLWLERWLFGRQRSENLLDLWLSVTIQLRLGKIVFFSCIDWVLINDSRVSWAFVTIDLISLAKRAVSLRLSIGLTMRRLMAKLHQFNKYNETTLRKKCLTF